MKEKIVSIIVPIYNAQKYLNRCIESITNQSYKSIDIVLVNDGSSDNSLKICRHYAQQDSRIKLIDIPNGGVSNARNVGIHNCSGEYVQFVDSDDYIEEEMTLSLVKTMEQNNVDFVVCGFITLNGQKSEKSTTKSKYNILEKKDIADNAIDLFNISFFNSSCNKLYKKVLIIKDFDVDFKIGEDMLFNLAYLENIQKVSVINESYYNYILNDASATHIISEDKIFRQIELHNKVKSWFENNMSESTAIIKHLNQNIVANLMNLVVGYCYGKIKFAKKIKIVKQVSNEQVMIENLEQYIPYSLEHKLLKKLYLKKGYRRIVIFIDFKKIIKKVIGK